MPTFIGEIKLFAGNFIPRGWLACEGQTLAISDYSGLAALIGTYYGGNGTSTFQLPDFRGKTPIGAGDGKDLTPRVLGQSGGLEIVTLQQTQIPAHNHMITSTPKVVNNLSADSTGEIKCVATAGGTQSPAKAFPAQTKKLTGDDIYSTDLTAATSAMNSAALEIETSLQGNIEVAVESVCGMTGGNLAHENMQPWLCMNYIINWDGIFPSRD
ncbi:MAG: tail fiber protein [Reichenbachiella sp.]|uniref:phage tail protein n=1 Tax=Reichenbachiella sp. TaxID=2184521 RepID=UPI003297B86E